MKSYSFLKKYLLAATATATLLFSACDLDEHPTSFVGPKEYYKTRAQCLAGLNACYIPINSIYAPSAAELPCYLAFVRQKQESRQKQSR